MQVTRIAPGWPVPSLMHRRRVMADRITYVGLDAPVLLRGGSVRLWHPTSFVGARARMHGGGALADPEAGGRPGQDRSAGWRPAGAGATGRGAGSGMGFLLPGPRG